MNWRYPINRRAAIHWTKGRRYRCWTNNIPKLICEAGHFSQGLDDGPFDSRSVGLEEHTAIGGEFLSRGFNCAHACISDLSTGQGTCCRDISSEIGRSVHHRPCHSYRRFSLCKQRQLRTFSLRGAYRARHYRMVDMNAVGASTIQVAYIIAWHLEVPGTIFIP